jgi:large subunit ribosomal protein L5
MSKDKDNPNPKGPQKDQQPKGERQQKAGGKSKGSQQQAKAAAEAAASEPVDTGPKVPPRLKVRYEQEVRGRISEKFGISNPMQMPRLEKIVLNVNMGRHLEGAKLPANVRSTVLETLTKITGQRPVVTKAKKSVANFKVREGVETAAMVTIRRERMWHFLDRLVNLATPRIRDFRGVSRDAFDKDGNYAMGLTEQGVFPEINMAEVTFTHGMNINVCFRNSSPDLSRFVLEQLGMPFKKPEDQPVRATQSAPPQPPQPAPQPAQPKA